MIEKPSISICIVNYNGLTYLKACFDSIVKSNYPLNKLEVIMVDNASKDGSIDFVKKEYPWVKVIALDDNYGFSKANNFGGKRAIGKYIVFLNNDTVVSAEWLNGLVEVMEHDSAVGIAGSKLLLMDTPDKLNSAGAAITFNGVGYDIGYMDNDSSKYNVPGEHGCVCAAAMMVRKDQFLEAGGFDEDHFMYFEDVDLCWRYWLYGKKVVYVPSSVVYHKFGGTTGSYRHNPPRVFYGTRNALVNIVKNYEACNIPVPLLFSLGYHLLKTFYFLLRLDFKLAFLMIKAYYSFFKLLPQTLAKRKVIQKSRKMSDRDLVSRSLIVPLTESFKEAMRLIRSKE